MSESLPALLAESDYVVVTTLTPQTENMLGEREFAR